MSSEWAVYYYCDNLNQIVSTRVKVAMSLISKEFRDGFLDTNRKVISLCLKQQLNVDYLQHRRDSIQGTDYIVNDIFLNLRVFRTKIEHLK